MKKIIFCFLVAFALISLGCDHDTSWDSISSGTNVDTDTDTDTDTDGSGDNQNELETVKISCFVSINYSERFKKQYTPGTVNPMGYYNTNRYYFKLRVGTFETDYIPTWNRTFSDFTTVIALGFTTEIKNKENPEVDVKIAWLNQDDDWDDWSTKPMICELNHHWGAEGEVCNGNLVEGRFIVELNFKLREEE